MPPPPTSRILLEVCVDSLESAIIAAENGADRLELCGNLPVGGGTTPSLGLVRLIFAHTRLPVMVLVRCRTGDFSYSPFELAVMVADIESIAELAQKHAGREIGVVIGALKPDGDIDEDAMGMLLQAAGNMPVTFHRAFDMVKDPHQALDTLSRLGHIKRILTSGQEPKCLDGITNILQLASSPHLGQLSLMPGSGINSSNVTELLEALLARGPEGWHGELHLSAGAWRVVNEGAFRRDGMGFGLGCTVPPGEENKAEREKREWGVFGVQPDELTKVRKLVDEYVARM